MSVLNLNCSAPLVFLQNVLVDANRVFDHAAGRKPLLHLAAARTAEILSKPFIVDQPQHHTGKLPAIGLRDQCGSLLSTTSPSAPRFVEMQGSPAAIAAC